MFTNRLFNPFPTIRLHKFSERELLSLAMIAVSLGALTIALLGGARLVWDFFYNNSNNSAPPLAGALVIGTAYLVGWLTALVAIRVYGNLILPSLINLYAWAYLFALCSLYMLMILKRSSDMQTYNPHYWTYLMIAAGLGAMVGLHLIIEDHNFRLFSIPLLLINLFHLGLIVYCYVIKSGTLNSLWKDLLLFFPMTAFSVLTTANLSILTPLRNKITAHFDRIAWLSGLTSERGNDKLK